MVAGLGEEFLKKRKKRKREGVVVVVMESCGCSCLYQQIDPWDGYLGFREH